uniref:ZP domain-containing protein n=1 Tax=Petromyzon marinus TaxID=7757 RepID=S4RX42_PETMA
FLKVTVSRILPPFSASTLHDKRPMSWYLDIDNGTAQWSVPVAYASQAGYVFDSQELTLTVTALYNASGVFYSQRNVHCGSVKLIYQVAPPPPPLRVARAIATCPGYLQCNDTSLVVTVPPLPGPLDAVKVGTTPVYPGPSSVPGVEVRLENSGGLWGFVLSLRRTSPLVGVEPMVLWKPWNTQVRFGGDGRGELAVIYKKNCEASVVSVVAECSTDGQMTFEVYASSTRPPLELATVHVRDPSCLPVVVTAEKAVFVVPLDACGTTQQMVDGKLVYENEAVSLMRDSIHVIISRSSEYRMKITCEFSGDDLLMLGVTVPTLSPPSPANGTGPLVIELTMFPDVDYVAPYVAADYPLVRFLREPLFVQVQLLAHPDPVLELRLADCWATSQPDPNSLPQWDLLVSGCPFSGDNYLSTIHTVSPASVPLHLRFKRFEVKTFVFADPAPLGALRDTLYFHCSATVCDSNSADLPQCGPSSCSPSTRRARRDIDQAVENGMTHVVSLAGPIVFTTDASKSRPSVSAATPTGGVWVPGLLAAACSVLAVSIAVALVAKLLC